jgi:hypothetical protein
VRLKKKEIVKKIDEFEKWLTDDTGSSWTKRHGWICWSESVVDLIGNSKSVERGKGEKEESEKRKWRTRNMGIKRSNKGKEGFGGME